MKKRLISISIIFGIIFSLFNIVTPVKAEDPFPSPDADGDSLANALETTGWYNLSGGPFITDPGDLDSDNDGLTDGEEKLFDTNPLDSHNPGLAARYDGSFNTLQYFSTTDPAYLSIRQGGDQYLMKEALVVRRGNTFNIAGPASGTLTLTGTGMTAITPARDPARGGWTITIPAGGTAGTYIATLTDGGWSKSMPVYVIFEIPTDMPQDQIDAFLYDGDPANKRDEVAVWWRMGYWNYYGDNQETVQPCPAADRNTPCSLWPYHLGYGMAQAYWTEQFTKSAFVNHAIKAIHGKNTLTNAVNAIASWTDVEFYTHAGTYQNNWSSSIYRYFDGTGYTMAGGDCESTATTFTTLLRSAGIPARPFAVDYVQTAGHGDPTWLITQNFEYDHSTMMWINGQWYAQRAYGTDELTVDPYYPFNSGYTTLQTWATVGRSGGTWYYDDEYGDVVVAVNEDWDFQNGSSGGGTVNTVWPVTTQEFASVNRDYQWDSKRPLEIMQSPDVEVFNYPLWLGDNWANTEWRTPVVSNPASPARDETLTYILPVGVPDPATPLENFPYNPQITSCSPATTTAECNAFKASKNLINLYITQSNGGTITASPALSSYTAGSIVTITATPATGYNFGAWTGACIGQTNPCTLTMNSSRTLGATFTLSGSSAPEGNTMSLPTLESATESTPSVLEEETVEPSVATLFKSSLQMNKDIQFGKILKDYGLDTDQNGKFDQLVIEVEITSAVKGNYQFSGQLLAGDKSFRAGRSISLAIGKQNVTLAFEGLPIGNNQARGPFEVQTLWIAEKDQPVGPFFLPEEFLAFQTFTYKTSRYRATEFETTAASFTDINSHQGVDKNRNGEFEAIRVDVGLNIAVSGAFLVEGDLFDYQGNYVSHASWTGNSTIASLEFNVAKSQPPYSIGNLTLVSKIGQQNGAMIDSRTYNAYEIKDMDGKIEGGAVEFVASDTISPVKTEDGSFGTQKVETVEPTNNAFTITPVDTNSNGKYDILRVNVSVRAAATDTKGNYRIEALLEDDYGNEVAWAVSGNQAIVPSITQTMTLDFDGKMLYDQLPLTGGKTLKLVAVKIFSGNLGTATLESEVKYAVRTPAYTRSQFEPSSPAITVFQDDMENGTDQWTLTGTESIWSQDAKVSGGGLIYNADIGPAMAGTFLLTVDSKTTVPLDWNISAANLKTALTNAGITTTTVTGSGTSASPWVITFTAAPANVAMDKTGLIMASDGGTHTWKASTTVNNVTQQLALATPLNLTDYASPVLRFNHAYILGNVNDKAILEASTNGTTWTALKTFTGINTTPHWIVEEIDLNAYGEMANVYLRFNAQRANATGFVYWYVDDVTINAWPAVKTVLITPPASVEEGVPATFTAGYTSINTSLPITYKWNIGEQEFVTTSPTINLVFPDAGNIPVTLTVSNPYDSTIVTQTVTVAGNSTNYVLTTNVTPAAGGTIVRNPNQQSYLSGTLVSLTASPAAGYTFTSWSGGGCGGTGTCTVTMNADITVTATFTPNEYTLTIIPDGPGTVTRVPNKATYHTGEVVQLTAVPSATYGFSQWEGDLTGSVNPVSITMNGNKTITAKFIQGYGLAVSTIGSGTVTKYPDQATYLPGQQVTLTAFPGTNWDFSAWGSACTGSGTCVVTMDRSKAVTATFAQTQYTLDIIPMPVGGTTSTVNKDPDQATYTFGQRVLLTPNPQLGWRFTGWGRDLTGSVNPSVITIDGNKTVYANFSNSWSFPGVTISPTGSGTVQKTATGYNPNRSSYSYGTVVTVTATPAEGWLFDHWDGSCTGTVNPCEVTVDGVESVTAYFINSAYTNVLTIDKTIGGTVTPNPTGGSYADGTLVTLTAVPATGYMFGQWNGDCTGQANPCSLTMDGSKNVSATFTPTTLTLTIINNPATGSGTTTPPAGVTTYPYGTVVNVFANPAIGYKFNSWTGDCSGAGACQVTMTANRSVTADFLAVNHNLMIAVDPSVGGTTTPAVGTYPYLEGTVVDVTATPLDGYAFAEWSGACSGIGGCTVTMDMPKTVTAIFAKDLEYLTVNVTGSGVVIQDPPPPYHHGDQVTLTADPDFNWEFTDLGGACTGQGNPCTLTMDTDKTVSAPFIQNLCYLPQNLIGDIGTLREDFESLTGWTVSGSPTDYSATLNTTDFKVGNSSIKLTPPTTYGYVSMIKTVNWDMSAPDERGNFRFWVYVHGTDEPVDFTITMSNNPQYSNTFVTYYNASYKFQYRPGWNLVNLKASDWNVGAGSPSWNNPIVSIRIAAYGTSATSYSIDGLESGTNGIPSVILTFDDGHNTIWNQAYAYMEPLNVRGTGYIITNQVDTVDRVTWAQLQAIYETGWTVGNHTAAHTTLTTLSLSDQEAALLAARTALNAHGLMNVDYVAYPYGNYNADSLTAMANLGMRTSRTLLNFNNVSPLTNPYELAQKSIGLATTWATAKGYVDTAISRGETVVLTLHDISVSPTSSGMTIDFFQDLVDYLISQGVPILTMDDLYQLQSGDIAIPRPIGGACIYGLSPDTYTLSYTAGMGGTLTGNAIQIVNHGANGTPVTAVENSGYHFVNWSDGVTTAARTETNVTANVSVTANFAINTYTLNYTPGAGGTLTGMTTQTVNYGANGRSVTAVPDTGYHFVNWSDSSTANPRSDTNVTANVSVTANFAINTYTLTYTASAGGTLTGVTPQTVNYGASGSLVTAVPDTGYHFVNWSDGVTTEARTDTNVTANVSVSANFAINTYTLTYTAGAGGTINGVSPQTVNHGENGTLVTAVPNTGYHFVNWSDGVTTAARTDTNVTANVSVTANFALDEFTLTVVSNHGTVTKAPDQAIYTYGTKVLLTMGTVEAGWTFIGWSGGSCSGLEPCSVDMIANTTVTANFTQEEYSLSVGIDPVASGNSVNLSNNGPYFYNDPVNLEAVSAPGWQFDHWLVGETLITENPTSVTITGHIVVTAYFIQIEYALEITQVTGGSISADPTGPYHLDDEVTLTAIPTSGWSFSAWTGNCSSETTDTCVLKMDSDKSVSAVFTQNPQNEYKLYLPLVIKGSTNSTGAITDSPESDLAMMNLRLVDIPGPYSSKFLMALRNRFLLN